MPRVVVTERFPRECLLILCVRARSEGINPPLRVRRGAGIVEGPFERLRTSVLCHHCLPAWNISLRAHNFPNAEGFAIRWRFAPL